MASKLKNAAEPAAPAVAFSYIRFSSREQRRGDSLRRQTEIAQLWCDRKGVKLDGSTTLHELGTSAFRGSHRKNPDRNALAAFLKLVEDGKVPRGSYLLIESLDRLTREHIRPALTLLLNLIEKGVRIVQMSPVEIIYQEDIEPMTLMMALMELSRGNSESRMKSLRSGANWENKRTNARNGQLATRKMPAWVRLESVERDRFTTSLIPERVETIRRIFALAAKGYGLMRIVKQLQTEELQPFGRMLSEKAIARYTEERTAANNPLTEEELDGLRKPGTWQKGRWVNPQWNTSYVYNILNDRRVLGEYQPRTGRGEPAGLPIAKYFPVAVKEKQFLAARIATNKRPRVGDGKRRRIGKYIELFTGLIKNALNPSDTYFTATRSEKRHTGKTRYTRVLNNYDAVQGRGAARSFPARVFERAILSQLRELDAEDVLGTEPSHDASEVEVELEEVRDRLAKIELELMKSDNVAALANVARQLEARALELSEELEEARQLDVRPLSDCWREIGRLANVLDSEEARLQLRASISRVVKDINLLVVPRGRDRLASVQVNFAGIGSRRNYLIIHRPALNAGGKVRLAKWAVRSIKHPDDGIPLELEDLGDPFEASLVEGCLKNYPKDLIDKLLRESKAK